MDLSALTSSLQATLGAQLPGILGALGILIIGWLVAVIARAGTRRLLGLLKVNTRIEESTGQKVQVEWGIAVGVFWVIILITLVAVFDSLHLDLISNPFAQLVAKIIGYLPSLVAGTILALVAWLLATLIRAVVNRLLASTNLDDRLSQEAGMEPMSKTVANVLFWLVILLFIPSILSAYELRGLLEPVQMMMAKLLGMVPNIVGAAIIGFVGWLVAKVLRGLVTNLLAAAGADRLAGQVGLGDTVKLSRLAGTIVFIFVFVPSLIAALDALQIDAISRPASEMLQKFLAAVPNIVAATLILVVTWYVAKFASGLLTRLLASLGTDTLPQKVGFRAAFSGNLRPSTLVGGIVLFFAMLFATVEAANRLDFHQVRDVVTMFIKFGGDVLLGGAILVIGFWLANLVYEAIDKASGESTTGLARIARVAILGLVIAMGLRAMGIADDIVNLAFGLTLGAIAVAFALSFGLGGREAAGRQMEHWLAKLRKGN
jgi:tetrahydromethanopterin S-methyltransferase subunit G